MRNKQDENSDRYDDLSEVIERIKTDLSYVDDSFNGINEDYKEQITEIDNLEGDVFDLKDDIGKLEDEKEELEDENEVLKDELQELEYNDYTIHVTSLYDDIRFKYLCHIWDNFEDIDELKNILDDKKIQY